MRFLKIRRKSKIAKNAVRISLDGGGGKPLDFELVDGWRIRS